MHGRAPIAAVLHFKACMEITSVIYKTDSPPFINKNLPLKGDCEVFSLSRMETSGDWQCPMLRVDQAVSSSRDCFPYLLLLTTGSASWSYLFNMSCISSVNQTVSPNSSGEWWSISGSVRRPSKYQVQDLFVPFLGFF
ncbi:hypothetical protein RRG08_036040 [Elysia crispata]|uniref:Uncharacterized protein n=1 Tax=Elysia crispata TaxID=231223 RepID=A0AAE1AN30_9GAST|nr:hypothetical protein RRG08_036040 [Elysia crispata]